MRCPIDPIPDGESFVEYFVEHNHLPSEHTGVSTLTWYEFILHGTQLHQKHENTWQYTVYWLYEMDNLIYWDWIFTGHLIISSTELISYIHKYHLLHIACIHIHVLGALWHLHVRVCCVRACNGDVLHQSLRVYVKLQTMANLPIAPPEIEWK